MFCAPASQSYLVVSNVTGWIYTICWSISFYPQICTNWRRKSVSGLSQDYCFLNVLGFLCYTISNSSFYFSSTIKNEFKERNNHTENTVTINDVVFATHGFAVTFITLLQIFYYRHLDERPTALTYIFYGLFFAVGGVYASIILISKAKVIEFFYFLSYTKAATTILKYSAQFTANYKAKSTVGWSISNVLLDLTGGTLSIFQLFLDGYCKNHEILISSLSNPSKFALGITSIVFDIMFTIQHFVLYRDRTDNYKKVSLTLSSDDDESENEKGH